MLPWKLLASLVQNGQHGGENCCSLADFFVRDTNDSWTHLHPIKERKLLMFSIVQDA